MVGKSCKRLRLLLVFETSKVTTGPHRKKKLTIGPASLLERAASTKTLDSQKIAGPKAHNNWKNEGIRLQ